MRERPTASATSARDDTPSFANTLVRWPSTVFWERNSSSAISPVGGAERHAVGDLELAPAERAEARALAEAPLARADPLAEAAEVARGLVAVAVGLARRERALRPGRAAAPPARCRPPAPARRRPASGSARPGPALHRLRALGGQQRQRGGLGRVAVGERQQRAGVQHPRLGERQLEPRDRLLGPRQPTRPAARAVAALELRARQHGVEPAAPPGLDQRELGQRPPPAAARCSGRARRSRARSRRRGRASRA